MPQLQFLTLCESPGTLTERIYAKLCLIIQIHCKNPGIEYVFPNILYKLWCGWKINHWQNNVHGERSAPFSTELICPCDAVDLFLKQGAWTDRGRTIDHLMYVVLGNVSVSLCALSGTSLAKYSLHVHLSTIHQSINYCIRQRHISLWTSSETRHGSTPFPVFSLSS